MHFSRLGNGTNLVHSGVLPRGLEARSADLLSTLGALTGINAATKTSNCWQGEDGDYVNYVKNEGTADMILLVWGPGGSFVNTIQPLITTTVAANETVPLSFANGASGAMSVAYEGTTMAWGQIANTWVEHTFSGDWSTIDVSREPNMNGDSMTVVTPAVCPTWIPAPLSATTALHRAGRLAHTRSRTVMLPTVVGPTPLL